MSKLVNFRYTAKRSSLFQSSSPLTKLLKRAPWRLLFLFLPFSLPAQYWTQATAIGSSAKESLGDLVIDAAGNRYLGGSFGDQLELGDQVLQSQGKDDVFLAKYNEEGAIEWVLEGGSIDFDQLSAITIDPAGDIVWGGQFWIEGNFGDLSLPLQFDSRGIYLLKHSPDGDLQWGRSIEGEDLKILSDIQTDTDGNIYLTGYFANTLIFADTTFQAIGVQNLFLLKFDALGNFLWGRTSGYQGEIRPQAMAISPQGQITIAGDFQGRAVFGADSIQTETQDRDVFVAAYDSMGNALWGRKAGGVFQDNCNAIALDADGNAYVTGRYLGVMTLSDSLEIQTDGFNENFYLIAYRTDGRPYLAKSLGGGGDEVAHDIFIRDEQLFLTGHYFGDLAIENQTLFGFADRFSAFVAVFDTSGNLDWMRRATSSQYVEGYRLVVNEAGRIWVAGNFDLDAQFDEQGIIGDGFNDLFFSLFDPLSTSTSEVFNEDRRGRLQIFPNPSSGPVTIRWEGESSGPIGLRLVDGRGAVVWQIELDHEQRQWTGDVAALPSGVYYWQWLVEGQFGGIEKMLIQQP